MEYSNGRASLCTTYGEQYRLNNSQATSAAAMKMWTGAEFMSEIVAQGVEADAHSHGRMMKTQPFRTA